jgi:hypothetical protein
MSGLFLAAGGEARNDDEGAGRIYHIPLRNILESRPAFHKRKQIQRLDR